RMVEPAERSRPHRQARPGLKGQALRAGGASLDRRNRGGAEKTADGSVPQEIGRVIMKQNLFHHGGTENTEKYMKKVLVLFLSVLSVSPWCDRALATPT